MAKGIELPTKVVAGRLKLLGSDQYIEQLIITALGDSESENPFQDLGLGEFMIFELNDTHVQGEIRDRVKAAFDTLERDQLAQLHSLSFKIDGAEQTMFIDYDNLETGVRKEIEVPIPSGG